jgi:hypothetical protein
MADQRIPFSRRVGATSILPLGMEDMPPTLRTSLWNIIEPWLWKTTYTTEYERRAQWIYNFHAIRWPTDEIPQDFEQHKATDRIKRWLLVEAKWHDVYDFVEAIPEMIAYGVHGRVDDHAEMRRRSSQVYDHFAYAVERYANDLDSMLEREGAPFRYRNLTLVQITSEAELSELSRAMTETPFSGARMHIENASSKLAQRPEPDYRNSIKESVSAVESLLQEATGQRGERLSKLLDAFETKYSVDLHGAFKSAIASLYGWTSDDGGIRHGIFGTETVTRAEAQFMLVACSALVNFMVSKASAAR